MSIQMALQFIQQLRADECLKKRIVTFKRPPDLESFVKLGAEMNLTFTLEELKAAHKHDWMMRWLRYKH